MLSIIFAIPQYVREKFSNHFKKFETNFEISGHAINGLYEKFIVPTPLRGGRNYILKWVFFVQSIFAGRYIHRRELRLVSSESSSSIEYGIKKILLIFAFHKQLSRFKVLWILDVIHLFLFTFLTKILSIFIKFS